MTLRAVIFDLGGTLIEYHAPRGWDWNGLDALRAYLVEQDYDPPDTERLLAIHERCVQDLHTQLETDAHATLTQDDIFRIMLGEMGGAFDPVQWAGVREAYYRGSLTDKAAVPHAVPTLKALWARGLKVAALSNTVWPKPRLDHVLNWLGLMPWLPVRLYSSEEAAWKPWPAIFRRTLDALDLTPDEAIYVGDSYRFDVAGAHGAGMRMVRIEQPGREPLDGETPDAEIKTLPELLGVVDRWMESV